MRTMSLQDRSAFTFNIIIFLIIVIGLILHHGASSKFAFLSSVSPLYFAQRARIHSIKKYANQPSWSHRCLGLSTLTPTTSSPPSTVDALKNPTNEISYDDHHHDRFLPGDPSRRAFTYFVLTGGRFLYAAAIRLAVLKFILSMTPSKDVLAMSSLEVDLSAVQVGQTITVKWRGKPVFVRRRNEKEVEEATGVDLDTLRDPEHDSIRVRNPEWLVVVGVCTHLGCVPIANAGDFGGRIRKGPAPTNLEVPEYKFLDETTLVVG